MKPHHLRNAPILEAVIDVRVAGAKVSESSEFRQIHAAVKDTYPRIEEIRALQATFSIDASEGAAVSAGAMDAESVGIRLTSEDERRVVQLRRDGYTFSRLAPYTSWDDIRAESWEMWARYAAVAKPDAVTRIALRYINKLDLPLESRDLSRFLTTPPRIPEGIPATISGFFHRTGVDCVGGKFKGWITQAAEPNANAGLVTVFLDFDVAQEGSFQIGDEIDSTLSELREIKNSMFFSSVTEKTLEMYR